MHFWVNKQKNSFDYKYLIGFKVKLLKNLWKINFKSHIQWNIYFGRKV
jgi:hypothetical protein